MTVSIEEHKEKFKRIEELAYEGFNIPRFYFLRKSASLEEFTKALKWILEIYNNSPEQIFNIRTYKYFDKANKETLSTPHLTDISHLDICNTLSKHRQDYSCLIDAETPDNGRLAGNILIEKDNSFTIEFVKKEKRAMVRDINKESIITFSGNFRNKIVIYEKPVKMNDNLSLLVSDFLIRKAFSFYKRDIILEWTYFCKPSGIFYNDPDKEEPESNIVWWEWRKM